MSHWKKRWEYFATHCLPPFDPLVYRQNVNQNYWDTHNIRHLFNIYPPRFNSNILRIWSQIQMDSMLYYSMAPSGLQVSSCNKSYNFYEWAIYYWILRIKSKKKTIVKIGLNRRRCRSNRAQMGSPNKKSVRRPCRGLSLCMENQASRLVLPIPGLVHGQQVSVEIYWNIFAMHIWGNTLIF